MGFLKIGLRIVGIALVFLGLLAGSVAIIGWLLSLVRPGPFLGWDNFVLALMCSLIACLFLAVFHLGRETIVVGKPAGFWESAKTSLEELGYEITAQGSEFLTTRPAFKSFLLGRGIHVLGLGTHARITGPKVWVETLRRRLHLQNILDQTQISVHERRRLEHERLLHRVHLQVRISQEQFAALEQQVIAPIAREAEVICEVNVLASSEAGIHESLIEGPIRDWLHEHGLVATIHKDFATLPTR